ncbi:MAG: fatty acid oxidation complex subunit alpha FadJ [Gemmatimonadetes bacterium]|nr:MAG: fatty acid oxidation complex subunit alpha FadJ [Gemmatimonadota bacterium]
MPIFQVTNEDGVAVVTMDLPGEPVNKLNAAAKAEFMEVFAALAQDGNVKAVVFLSGKPDTFIAGADIEEFTKVKSREEAEALSRGGQAMLDAVANLSKPVVAAIHGACLGGGLEFALACHYRVGSSDDKTQLGLPEVQLGLLPGAGGCQRLPRLIGLRAALDMILAGKSVRARKAYRLGLVDELVPQSILRQSALAAARKLSRDPFVKRAKRGTGFMGLLLDRNPLGRRLVYSRAGKSVRSKTGGHYPAPLAALDCVRIGLEKGMAAGLVTEHSEFGRLAVTDVSRKLIQIFFGTTALKKDDGVPRGTGTALEVRRMGVVGSGFMGAGIAGTAVSRAQVEVRLKDTDLGRVAVGLKAARSPLDKGLARRRLTRYDYARQVALLSGTTDMTGFGRSELVVEAVFEDLEVKRKVLAEFEEVLPDGSVYATNTSTIPIQRIADGAAHPERVIGMHFFSPVEKMPLLEVIPGKDTNADTIVTAVRFGRRMGKTVIVVRDHPGFWVNRILSPYMNEAGHLLKEGTPIEAIDRTMTRYGFPVGPIALLDEVGIDVAQKASGVMHEAFGERLRPAPVIDALIGDRRLGRKNGRGLYRYEKGKKKGPDKSVYRLLGVQRSEEVSPETIEQRLLFAMLNEAAMAVGEGVVQSPRDGDIGAIFGIGFPPFRGGPLRVIDTLGAARVVDVLQSLAAMYGPRFTPCDALVEQARANRKFYPD